MIATRQRIANVAKTCANQCFIRYIIPKSIAGFCLNKVYHQLMENNNNIEQYLKEIRTNTAVILLIVAVSFIGYVLSAVF
jgi:hypothetical protein